MLGIPGQGLFTDTLISEGPKFALLFPYAARQFPHGEKLSYVTWEKQSYVTWGKTEFPHEKTVFPCENESQHGENRVSTQESKFQHRKKTELPHGKELSQNSMRERERETETETERQRETETDRERELKHFILQGS